jgi:hypothetical protein
MLPAAISDINGGRRRYNCWATLLPMVLRVATNGSPLLRDSTSGVGDATVQSLVWKFSFGHQNLLDTHIFILLYCCSRKVAVFFCTFLTHQEKYPMLR